MNPNFSSFLTKCFFLAVILIIPPFSIAPAIADITTDGTVGTAKSLFGPDHAIPAELGKQTGGNLFHSFGVFNINNL